MSVYVLDGPEEGWHDFDAANAGIEFCKLMQTRGYDFLINPEW